MNDIIALRLRDGKRGNAAFITWGRVYDPIDTDAVERAMAKIAAEKFGFHDIKTISVCKSLQEVSHYPYFYESLVSLAWKPIPFGKKYKLWAAKKRKEISAGKEVYFLGISGN